MVLLIGDYFVRHVAILYLLFTQIVITAISWIIVKCNHILPINLTFVADLIRIFITTALVIILPHVVKICEISQKFVLQRRAVYYTVNRHKTTYYYFIKWKS